MKKICLLLYVCVLSIQSFAQNFPFEVCLDGINDNTKWYYVKINNKYIGADDQLKLFVSDRVKDTNVDKYLWAFIDAGKESFYLTNRYLGNSYRLGSNSRSSVIQYGDLAVMKQGVGRKMHYKNTKNGGAGIYTKNMFNTYLGTNNSLVGFVDSRDKADIIVDFAKSESDINREIEAEKNRKAVEAKKKAEEQARKQEEERLIREKIKAMPSEAFLGTWEALAGSTIPGNKQIFRKDGSKGEVGEREMRWKIGGIMCNFKVRVTYTKTTLWRKVDDKIILDTKSISDVTVKVIDVDYSNMTAAQRNKVKAGIPAFERFATKEARDDWAKVMKPSSDSYTIIEIRDDYMHLQKDPDGTIVYKLRKIN